LVKEQVRFCNVFQINNTREISYFPEYQAKFWDQYTLKKADPDTFLLWVDSIFAKKQALFDIYGLTHHFKCTGASFGTALFRLLF